MLIERIMKGEDTLRAILSESGTMTSDEMEAWIESNELTDAFGELDYNDIKHIAGYSDAWVLRTFKPHVLADFEVPPQGDEPRDTPVIVLDLGEGSYEVLDGKHRVAEHNYAGKPIKAWVGTPEQ